MAKPMARHVVADVEALRPPTAKILARSFKKIFSEASLFALHETQVDSQG